ncbi:spermidine synthase [Cellulomonas bogoriensis]|uniref:Spermidine synthase n=1 Tax=Cellulomonas bogoriensis 69B4 = DSM 16987 TaxID=1386082 RepID=A0A0A0BY51_9CELL|nr:fused MFS/spermidine synthase [Cellulomonas bogoriensis]KGM13303.1 spermidine synthase [Cellulomonas bogoriensis 69B4 = DSM 16987]
MPRSPRRAVRPTDARPLPVGPQPIDTGTAELVPDRGETRAFTVHVNGVPSSHVHLDRPDLLDFEYMQHMAAVVDQMPPGGLRVLHLGAGACTMARWVDHRRPGSNQLAVDVDARLVDLVRTWFDLPRAPALRLRAEDANLTVAQLPPHRWDVVIRDVFNGDRTPTALATTTSVAQIAQTLRPGGLYLANCADRPPLTLARAEVATLAQHFSHVGLLAEPGQLRGRRYGNLVLVGTEDPDLLGGSGLGRALRSLPQPARVLHGDELTSFTAGARPLRDGTG